MRPAPFNYSRPTSLAVALAAVADGAVPLAGGQSLLQAMRLRASEPAVLVDLNAVAEFSTALDWQPTQLTIGALTTHAGLLEDAALATEFPWLAEAARALGDVQVRNLGTTLGNVCWADPRANMVIALMASDANILVRGAGTTAARRVPVTDFITGFRRNSLNGELAVGIEVPRRHARGCYLEFSRQQQDLALVNVCVVCAPSHARVAIGGIHQRPVRCPALEQALAGLTPGEPLPASSLATMFDGLALDPLSDPYGAASYKLQLARVLVLRALAQLAEQPSHA